MYRQSRTYLLWERVAGYTRTPVKPCTQMSTKAHKKRNNFVVKGIAIFESVLKNPYLTVLRNFGTDPKGVSPLVILFARVLF